MTHPYVHVVTDDPHPADVTRQIVARSGDGLDFVEVRLRSDLAAGPGKALKLLTRVLLEVVVRARESRVERAPVPASREMEGARWNG